jgi:hypothetical protein
MSSIAANSEAKDSVLTVARHENRLLEPRALFKLLRSRWGDAVTRKLRKNTYTLLVEIRRLCKNSQN